MTKKVCIITSVHSVGCTFIDWSIHFLSGQTQYHNVKLKKQTELCQNPLTGSNAHNHLKNHPVGFEDTKSEVNYFNALHNSGMYSTYAVPMHYYIAAELLGISTSNLEHNNTLHSQITQYINKDYNKIFDLAKDNQAKIVFVSADPRTSLYHQNVRSLDTFSTKPGKPSSSKELTDEIQKVFFSSSQHQWKDLNLTDIWDTRERMALNIRPFDKKEYCKFDFSSPHLWINCQDLWSRTSSTIKKIMLYLELEIDEQRLHTWTPICDQWQRKQLDLLEFNYNQPHIVDAIVNNWHYDIDLTFDQEVIIQHCLIYQHNLNLKTWQLEKFPSNTKDLHKLLETNIHLVPKIY